MAATSTETAPLAANPRLEIVQALPTSGARAAAAFSIDNQQFLAIAQLAEDIPGAPQGMNLGNSDISLIIYRLNEYYLFEQWQQLPVHGGEDAEFFTIEGRHFLATASIRSGRGPYNLNDVSSIFEWKSDRFVLFQSIPTFAAKQWRYFCIRGRHFLALAQGVEIPGIKSTIPPESSIFEWDSSQSLFLRFQTVPSVWGYNWLHFSLAGHEFLAYADHIMPSTIFRWDGSCFISFQTLNDRKGFGRAFCFIETSNNDALLAFANIAGDSLLYYWNGENFQLRQRLNGPGGREWATFKKDGEVYVVHIRFITGTPHDPDPALLSSVYRVEEGSLLHVLDFPTSGATDATAVTINGDQCLVVSESLAKDLRFRVDSHIYRFILPTHGEAATISQSLTTYQSKEFLTLFDTYTSGPNSIGSQLAEIMSSKTATCPLLIATSGSLIFYPGSGLDPSYINFRKVNRGFKELAAISHLGPALASIVKMHNAAPDDEGWRIAIQRLIEATETTRRANSVKLWLEKIQIEAFRGREAAIAAMIDYACNVTVLFLRAVLDDPTKLTAEILQNEYLESRGPILRIPIPFNAIMIATFFLVGLDLAYRIKLWLRDYNVDWTTTMAIIVGRQGRETSGVTLSTNSVAQVILESSGLELPADRLYIAPHGPNITVEGPNEIQSIRQYENSLRLLWNRNHAIGELGQTMFAGYPAFKPQAGRPIIESGTNELSDMPSIKSPDDWISLTTRMRIVLEDPRQLLSGCVTDYAAQQLRLHNDDPTAIVVPGLDNFDYPRGPRTPIYPCATPDGALNQTDEFMFTIDNLGIQTEFKFPCRKCVVDRGELAFWEEGSGSQAIIWIHGLPLASQSWGAQRRHFYKKNRNIYMDLRGYGESSKIPLDVQDVTNMHCADLRTLMDSLKLDRAHIVGFASAGHYALRFAAQSPERIDKLVAINGAALFRQRSDWPWGFSDEAIDKFTSAAARDGIEGMTNKILDPTVVFRDLSHSDAENVVRWFCQMSYKAGVQTLLSFFDHVSSDDDRHLMSSIDAPTLLISGLLGQEVPSQSGLYLRQEIPHARLVEVPDADHFLFITRPRVINQLVDGFLNSNSARINT